MDLYKKYDRNHKILNPWIYKDGGQLHLAQRLILSPLGAKGNTCYKDAINICYQFYIDSILYIIVSLCFYHLIVKKVVKFS